MKRKMLFFERIMYFDGQTPVNCLITARIRGSIAVDDLRAALDKVQAKHPLLRAHVEEEDRQLYFVFDANPPKIPLRIVERQAEGDWLKNTKEEWKKPFDMVNGPLVRMVWIRSDEVSELLLVGHHCACDGASLVSIYKELLLLVDQPDLPLIAYEPFQSLKDLIPKEIFSNVRKGLVIRGKAALARLFFALTSKKAAENPQGEHYLLCSRADEKASTAFADRCKKEGTTPYSAMCVAFMQAFGEVRRTDFKNKMMCPVNIRRYVKSIAPDMIFNYAPTVMLSLSTDQGDDFWGLAKKLKQSMLEEVERLDAYEYLMAAEHLHAAIPKLITLLPRLKGKHDFIFSNVGRLEIQEDYRTFKVESFLSSTTALPWRDSTTIVTTSFRGQIDLAFVSNESFLPYADAVAIRERALHILTDVVEAGMLFESSEGA
ncbi:condensation domain-containing protein [Granulicella arctica]|uniref:Condensation domain-containing protein n=1 Tax=Granulicella arctica TaxID=940613 RepID=A0A7Y9PGS4_9BACT|nr:condensation domain-containing protein [Granulicella arctica]NYF79597.1 hypothetical protein [Granulicella arctica]